MCDFFVKKDVTGKDVYRYETLDLAWGFTSYDRVTYVYEYMMDPDEQMKALDIIENYLKLAAKPLYPFNFFAAKSAKITDSNAKEEICEKGAYTINYRTLALCYRRLKLQRFIVLQMIFAKNFPDTKRNLR